MKDIKIRTYTTNFDQISERTTQRANKGNQEDINEWQTPPNNNR